MKKLSVKSNSGQALLVILLMMAVILTIGLATISRSVTDIKISEQTEDSARAFSAAEAGIEAALSGVTSGLSFGPGVSVDVPPPGSLLSLDKLSFLYPEKLSQNEIATIWLSEHDKNTGLYSNLLTTGTLNPGTLTFGWGNPGTDTPALEVSIYYNNSGIKVAKFMFDPVDTRANSFCNNNAGQTNCPSGVTFPSSGISISGQDLKYQATIPVTGLNMYFVRLRLLYAGTAHFIGIRSPVVLPSQGQKIAATGTSNQATRKVEVYRLNPAPPDIFDFALYSGGSLVK